MGLRKFEEENYEKEIRNLKSEIEEWESGVNAEQEDDSGAWLTSYADLMTLVACFFILMMAFANYDPVGFQRKTKEVAKHFSGKALNKDESELDQLVRELQGNPDLSEKAKIAVVDDGIKIVFKSNHLFERGEPKLRGESLESLDIMIDLIYQKNPDYRVMVEGHTDNLSIPENSPYKTPWELSAARASSIVERFQEYGFNKDSLVAVGYGDSRPVAPNQDAKGRNIEENIALNRRAVIKVLEPLKSRRSKRMGLGIYFTESELFPEQ